MDVAFFYQNLVKILRGIVSSENTSIPYFKILHNVNISLDFNNVPLSFLKKNIKHIHLTLSITN
jgi:hypothetical protein